MRTAQRRHGLPIRASARAALRRQPMPCRVDVPRADFHATTVDDQFFKGLNALLRRIRPKCLLRRKMEKASYVTIVIVCQKRRDVMEFRIVAMAKMKMNCYAPKTFVKMDS